MKEKLLLILSVMILLMLGIAHAEIGTPANPVWKEDSAATAAWESVEGSNYYAVDVYVYVGEAEIGTVQTGTSDTELDVQQEIHRIAGDRFDVVQVCFSVTAQYIDPEGNITCGSASPLSDRWEYDFLLNLLPPQQITLHDDGTLEWNTIRSDCYYELFIYLGSVSEGFYYQDSVIRKSDGYTTDNNVASCCIAADIQNTIDHYDGVMHGASFLVSVSMKTLVDYNGSVRKSPESPLCNSIEWFDADAINVAPPQAVSLSDHYILSWDLVDHADSYELELYMSSSRSGFHYLPVLRLSEDDYTVSGNTGTYDLSKVLPELCREFEPDVISSMYFVTANMKTIRVYNQREYMSIAAFCPSTVAWVDALAFPLEDPKNIQLTSSGILSWDQVENSEYYIISLYVGPNQGTFIYLDEFSVSEESLSQEGIRRELDISDRIQALYNAAPDDLGDIFAACVSMRAGCEIDGQCYQSVATELQCNREFHAKKPVESLTLAPAAPVLYCGNSLYLGKTISPEDAYYTGIDWTTTDAGIVTVDSSGRMTGVMPGTAEVTASIGDASCTVPVTVYTISSNIENEEDEAHVTDTAGSIIDDIVNSEHPDLDGTDISSEELDDVRQEVQAGIWRGDELFTDILWYEENFSKYQNNWGQIQKAARELTAEFGGAYNIEVEMYHKDKEGAEHLIGHIVEFENEINFAFDLPTGMSELQSGYTRKYVLVRIHNNSIEPIAVEVTDNQFSARSDRFSDFVLLYVDEPTGETDLSGYSQLRIPDSVTVIEAEAFAGITAEVVFLPGGSLSIGSRVFADCPNLKYIVIPSQAAVSAAEDAYDGCSAEIIIQ